MEKICRQITAWIMCVIILFTMNYTNASAAENMFEADLGTVVATTDTTNELVDHPDDSGTANEITDTSVGSETGDESDEQSADADEIFEDDDQDTQDDLTENGTCDEPDDEIIAPYVSEILNDSNEAVDIISQATDSEKLKKNTDFDMADALEAAECAFVDLASSKDLMALIYLTDVYDVKEEADSESIVTASIASGHTVYVKEVRIEEGQVWYKVSFWLDGIEQSGYVEEPYLAYADEDWTAWREEYLLPLFADMAAVFSDAMTAFSADGFMTYSESGYADIDAFPIAFQNKLLPIKKAHSNWIFVPVNTGLDFNTAVSNEMGDKSWIQGTQSNKNAGYTGNATGQGSWCYATKKAVSYYMDTCNYLDETHIFAFEQLTFNGSYHTESAVQKFLNNTFMKGNLPDESRTYANAFFNIGKDRKLSPTHLASRVYQEQGKGTSPLISGKYEGSNGIYKGYYNYFNVGASGNSNTAVIESGLKYAKEKGWNTAYKSLSGGAATIGNNYILKGQDTIYLQKFNVAPGASNAAYTHQYMQNIQAPWTESASTQKIYNDSGSLNSAFVFKIPIYKDMPNEIKNPIKEVTLEPSSLILRRIDTIDPDSGEGVLLSDGSLNTEQFQLKATLVPTIGGEKITDDTTITWKSSDQRVAIVAADGTITAVNEGTAIITATASKAASAIKPAADCEVKIIAPVENKIIKCSVRFYDESGTHVLKTIEGLDVGNTVKEDDFPDVSDMETAAGGRLIGWYTQKDGNGEKFTAATAVFEPETILYPCFAVPEEGFYVVPVGSQTYSGSAVKPTVTVYDAEAYENGQRSTAPLVLNKDYTVSYRNNTKVNTSESKRPTIVVKGKGNYSGTKEIYFDIFPVSLKRSDIRVENVMAKYNGKVIKSLPVVMQGTKKLTKGKDYILRYPETCDGAYKEPGKYTIEIAGIGGYYTEPDSPIKIYEIITKGTLTAKKNLSKAKVTGIVNKVYTGNPEDAKQSFELTMDGVMLTESFDGVQGDFVTVYKNLEKAGTATVEFHGIGNYTGTLKKTFKIDKADLKALEEQERIAVVYQESCPYLKGKTISAISITYKRSDGETVTLVKDTDYTVSYKNNTRVTTDEMKPEQKPLITIKGKGNFKGTITRSFVITDGKFEDTSKLTLEAKDIVYKKKSGFYKTTVTIKDQNDSTLRVGTDYSKEYEYYYVGSPDVVDAAGTLLSRSDGDPVERGDLPLPGTKIRVYVKAMGAYQPKDGHTAKRYAEYRIILGDIGKAKVKVVSGTKPYLSGWPVTLTGEDLVVTMNGMEMVCGKDYVIDEASYKNNVGKGTASVVIRGCQSVDANGVTSYYGGTKMVKFKIGSRLFFW